MMHGPNNADFYHTVVRGNFFTAVKHGKCQLEIKSDDRQNLDVGTIELVEAAPTARLSQAREELGQHLWQQQR